MITCSKGFSKGSDQDIYQDIYQSIYQDILPQKKLPPDEKQPFV
jgi:hypothetical protein